MRLVFGDAAQPGTELTRIVEGVEPVVGFEKGLLGEVIRIVRVRDPSQNDAIHQVLVPVYQLGEPLLVSLQHSLH